MLTVEVHGQDRSDETSSSDSLTIQPDLLPARTDTLLVTGAGPFLIHPLLVASSVDIWIENEHISPANYDLDLIQGYVFFHNVDPDSSFSFIASYRYFPIEIEQGMRLWSTHDVSEERERIPPVLTPSAKNITSRGSITRGIMSGTGRDASVESGLRLEVEGEITDSIMVRAVLTDEDTPLLPEGTTSRLDQFDQIFIEFESGKGKIALGDIDVALSKGRFSTVKRRIQGIEVDTRPFFMGNNQRLGAETTVVASTSKGKFQSQRIPIIEGVQGPYRLEGETSERFILILPGTERVYVDGLLLDRGLDSDYIIDYTTAELTFTPSHLVGSDSRVIVEFEYTTNQYTRSFLATESEVSVGLTNSGPRITMGVSAIREADGDNFAEELGFTGQDSLLIIQSGDALVLRSSATEVPYDAEALFTQYFSVMSSDGTPYFEAVNRLPFPGERVYRVAFTRLPSGTGSYKRVGGSSVDLTNNGIVFNYVGPGNGDYDAVRPLTAPTKKELLDVRLGLTNFRYATLSLEFAASDFDKNTLSGLDAADDVGNASKFKLETKPIRLGSVDVVATTEWMKRSTHFTTFDRSRPIEYERNWNLGESATSTQENLLFGQSEESLQSTLSLRQEDSTTVEVGVDALRLGSLVRATRQRVVVFIPEKRWSSFQLNGTRVSKKDIRIFEGSTAGGSDWLNVVSRLSRSSFSVVNAPYIEWETERFGGQQTPSLERQTIKDYDEFRVGGQIGPSTNQINAFAEHRLESDPESASSKQAIQTLQTQWMYSHHDSFRSSVSLGIRKRFGDEQVTDTGARNSIILGATGNARLSAGNNVNWTYSVQSEQSARLQEIYIKTGQERGQYVWQDVNGDGVIQIEEFVPETIPGEGEYALTYFPSDTLESITALTASLRFSRLGNKEGKALQRIGLGTVVEVSERSRDPQRAHLYLLQLGTFRKPGQTVNGRFRFKQDVRLLPSNTTYDLDLSWTEIRSFSDLSSGVQRNRLTEYVAFVSYRPILKWTTSARLIRSQDGSQSSFASRSFDILGYEVQPKVSFEPSREWTFDAGVYWANRTERTFNAKVRAIQVPLSGLYRSGSKWTARAHAEWSDVSLTGPSRGLQTYQLTDGRGAGSSWLWGLSLNARVSEVVTATLGYDGRSPATGQTIHTGRVQFMARF